MSRVTSLFFFISALTQNSVSPHPVGVTSLVYLLFFISGPNPLPLTSTHTNTYREGEASSKHFLRPHRIVKSRGENKHFFLLSPTLRAPKTQFYCHWSLLDCVCGGRGEGALVLIENSFTFFKGTVLRDFRHQDCLTNHLPRALIIL